jgi:hypothetical protein
MQPEVLGIMIPIIAIIGVFIMIIYLRKYTNIERMAMIDKGVSAELFNSMNKPGIISASLRASLLLIGGGLGLLLGYLLDNQFNMEEVGYFSMLFICGGIGLGLAYLIEEKKAAREKK